MPAVAKLPEVPKQVDWSKPVLMRWWKLPKGEFVGNSAQDSMTVKVGNLPATFLSDSFGTSGTVETIERQPNGRTVIVGVRCSDGDLRTYCFDVGGHGVPL